MKAIPCLAAILLLLGASRSAEAHPPPFWWMTDMSGTSRAGVELTAGTPELAGGDADTLGGSLFAEVAVTRAIAIHGRVPLTFVFFDPAVDGEDGEAALGNLSLGLQATSTHRTGADARTMFGGGLTVYFPTASDGSPASSAVAATRQLYLPDPGRWLVDTTTLRFRGDARVESGSLFFQGELALDAHFRDGDDELDLVLGLGPGFAVTHHLAFLLEVAAVELIDDDNDEQFTLDLGLRYHTSSLMMGMRFYLPLSDPLRDNEVFGLGFDVGARF